MKKTLVCLLSLTLGVSLCGFTFYEDPTPAQQQPSLESFLAGDAQEPIAASDAKTGLQYDYYRDYSISFPLILGPMEVDVDSMGIFAVSPDDNISVMVLREDTYGSYFGEDLAGEMDEMINELNYYFEDEITISGTKEVPHPLADKAYERSIIFKDDFFVATCKVTYFQTQEGLYFILTGYMENPGADIVAALDSIPLTLTEYK